MKKVILHLCADIGSDSRYFDLDPDFEVIKVGADVGVENFTYTGEVHGVIANPVCTKFTLRSMCSQGFAKALYLANRGDL